MYFCPVKSSPKTLSVIILSVIYCLGLSATFNTWGISSNQDHPTHSQTHFFSEFSKKQVSHTTENPNSLNQFNKLPSQNFKNAFLGIGSISKTTELLLNSTFHQYLKISINLLVKHRKSDLIFPFHYFW